MIANETPRGNGAIGESAGRRVLPQDTNRHRRSLATVEDVIERRRAAHELRVDLWDLWRDGFRAGQEAAHARVRAAEAAADSWYYVANNPTQVRAEHERTLKLFRVALARKSEAERWAALDRIAAQRAEVARG